MGTTLEGRKTLPVPKIDRAGSLSFSLSPSQSCGRLFCSWELQKKGLGRCQAQRLTGRDLSLSVACGRLFCSWELQKKGVGCCQSQRLTARDLFLFRYLSAAWAILFSEKSAPPRNCKKLVKENQIGEAQGGDKKYRAKSRSTTLKCQFRQHRNLEQRLTVIRGLQSRRHLK